MEQKGAESKSVNVSKYKYKYSDSGSGGSGRKGTMSDIELMNMSWWWNYGKNWRDWAIDSLMCELDRMQLKPLDIFLSFWTIFIIPFQLWMWTILLPFRAMNWLFFGGASQNVKEIKEGVTELRQHLSEQIHIPPMKDIKKVHLREVPEFIANSTKDIYRGIKSQLPFSAGAVPTSDVPIIITTYRDGEQEKEMEESKEYEYDREVKSEKESESRLKGKQRAERQVAPCPLDTDLSISPESYLLLESMIEKSSGIRNPLGKMGRGREKLQEPGEKKIEIETETPESVTSLMSEPVSVCYTASPSMSETSSSSLSPLGDQVQEIEILNSIKSLAGELQQLAQTQSQRANELYHNYSQLQSYLENLHSQEMSTVQLEESERVKRERFEQAFYDLQKELDIETSRAKQLQHAYEQVVDQFHSQSAELESKNTQFRRLHQTLEEETLRADGFYRKYMEANMELDRIATRFEQLYNEYRKVKDDLNNYQKSKRPIKLKTGPVSHRRMMSDLMNSDEAQRMLESLLYQLDESTKQRAVEKYINHFQGNQGGMTLLLREYAFLVPKFPNEPETVSNIITKWHLNWFDELRPDDLSKKQVELQIVIAATPIDEIEHVIHKYREQEGILKSKPEVQQFQKVLKQLSEPQTQPSPPRQKQEQEKPKKEPKLQQLQPEMEAQQQGQKEQQREGKEEQQEQSKAIIKHAPMDISAPLPPLFSENKGKDNKKEKEKEKEIGKEQKREKVQEKEGEKQGIAPSSLTASQAETAANLLSQSDQPEFMAGNVESKELSRKESKKKKKKRSTQQPMPPEQPAAKLNV